MSIFLKSALGANHAEVINGAPESERRAIVQTAMNALRNAYESDDTPEREATLCYLDLETLNDWLAENPAPIALRQTRNADGASVLVPAGDRPDPAPGAESDEWQESRAGLSEEDSSVRVTFKRTGESVILSDTGNGGAAAYDVLREAPGTPDGFESVLPWPESAGTLDSCRAIAKAYLSGRARAMATIDSEEAPTGRDAARAALADVAASLDGADLSQVAAPGARYTVSGMDCAAEGMERLRDQSEFILLAYVDNANAGSADVWAQWLEDIDSCARPDGFDYLEARQAVRTWAADNESAILAELAGARDAAQRGDLNWNDASADEFDSVTFRLYVRDNREEESGK